MSKSAKKTKTKKVNSHNVASFAYQEYFLHYLFCVSIIVLLILTSININHFLDKQKVLGAEIDTTDIQNEKAYWQKIITDNPTYIDGYLYLAKSEVELGNLLEAHDYLTKAISLDPNSPKILAVKQKLGL